MSGTAIVQSRFFVVYMSFWNTIVRHRYEDHIFLYLFVSYFVPMPHFRKIFDIVDLPLFLVKKDQKWFEKALFSCICQKKAVPLQQNWCKGGYYDSNATNIQRGIRYGMYVISSGAANASRQSGGTLICWAISATSGTQSAYIMTRSVNGIRW